MSVEKNREVKLEEILLEVSKKVDSNQGKKKIKKVCLLQIIEKNMEKVGKGRKRKKSQLFKEENKDGVLNSNSNTPPASIEDLKNVLSDIDNKGKKGDYFQFLPSKKPGNNYFSPNSNIEGAERRALESSKGGSINDNHFVDGSNNDPFEGLDYDPLKAYRKIQKEIQKLLARFKAAEKSGVPFDATFALMKILGEMANYGKQTVGVNSIIGKALTKYKQGIANLNKIIGDKDGKQVQDINPYTGKKEIDKDGNPVKVSPEKAIADQAAYLINNPHTKYELDSSGKIRMPKKVNPAYIFYKKNPQSYNDQLSNIQELIQHLGGTVPPLGKDGKVPIDNNGLWKIPKDEIKKMWEKANPNTSALDSDRKNALSKDHPVVPDSSQLNSVMTDMTEMSGAYDSSTNTQQTFLKNSAQEFQAETTLLKNFAQGINTFTKTLVSAQKTN